MVDVLGLVCPDYKMLLRFSRTIFSQGCIAPPTLSDMKAFSIWATALTVLVTVVSAQANDAQDIVNAIFASATAGMIRSYYTQCDCF
jgi:hypothetical protein